MWSHRCYLIAEDPLINAVMRIIEVGTSMATKSTRTKNTEAKNTREYLQLSAGRI